MLLLRFLALLSSSVLLFASVSHWCCCQFIDSAWLVFCHCYCCFCLASWCCCRLGAFFLASVSLCCWYCVRGHMIGLLYERVGGLVFAWYLCLAVLQTSLLVPLLRFLGAVFLLCWGWPPSLSLLLVSCLKPYEGLCIWKGKWVDVFWLLLVLPHLYLHLLWQEQCIRSCWRVDFYYAYYYKWGLLLLSLLVADAPDALFVRILVVFVSTLCVTCKYLCCCYFRLFKDWLFRYYDRTKFVLFCCFACFYFAC